jgi:hypothetical protein
MADGRWPMSSGQRDEEIARGDVCAMHDVATRGGEVKTVLWQTLSLRLRLIVCTTRSSSIYKNAKRTTRDQTIIIIIQQADATVLKTT